MEKYYRSTDKPKRNKIEILKIFSLFFKLMEKR